VRKRKEKRTRTDDSSRTNGGQVERICGKEGKNMRNKKKQSRREKKEDRRSYRRRRDRAG